MPPRMTLPRAWLAAALTFASALALALAGCIARMPLEDSRSVNLAETLNADAATFFATLAEKPTPQCSYEQNKNFYEHLITAVHQLRDQLSISGASPARVRAASALARAIEAARASHEQASARINDLHGQCMAPGAIALNAEAIARAGSTIAIAPSITGEQ